MLRGDFQHLAWMAHGRSMSYRADPRRLKAEQRIACNENNAIPSCPRIPDTKSAPLVVVGSRILHWFEYCSLVHPWMSYLWWKCIPHFFGLDKFLWHQDFQQVLRAHVFQIPGENMQLVAISVKICGNIPWLNGSSAGSEWDLYITYPLVN
jgi:hypothetical protein